MVAGMLVVLGLATIMGVAGAEAAPSIAPVLSQSGQAAGVQEIAAKHGDMPKIDMEDVPGRYAVMREKRDTGCMLTLDKSRVREGDRAQLAPGCRDQGIVVFDPSAWQIVKGELVLIARAGHRTVLEHQPDGAWVKNVTAGSKPLGLKKL